MKKTDRPDDNQKCARDGCEHTYGQHYATNDRKARGCSGTFDAQRDGVIGCDCNAFLISYEYA